MTETPNRDEEPTMDRQRTSDILARITIGAYGLGGAELEDGEPGAEMILTLGNGQRFAIRVSELEG